MERLGTLRERVDRLTESFDVGLRHLSHAQRQFEETTKRLTRLDASVEELAGADDAVQKRHVPPT